MASKKTTRSRELVQLTYSLAELPSAQHRAGLAGLVLACRWLERVPHEVLGTCRLDAVEPGRASLTVDFDGLSSLLDQVYKAAMVEAASVIRCLPSAIRVGLS